ncbi:Scm-like with four mbt domains [Desmophyllum pertusum]|uniref:Scm-like with four mbt domains n=1 Tax=Desmophyllum pertusum TaxID=174260 RepID=A0A9W9YTU4_9CNID|nr:Scm-like with four mbt domains [Desmophyllum pertusum]
MEAGLPCGAVLILGISSLWGGVKRTNIQLTPPPGYLVHPFQWQTYLQWTNSSAASESLFHLEVPFHEFDISMKLEAVDQTDPSTMTVATVTQVVGRTMWVLLDGYKHDSVEHIYDVESFDLYPVGWCRYERASTSDTENTTTATRQRGEGKTRENSIRYKHSKHAKQTQTPSTARINNISTLKQMQNKALQANSVNTTPVSNAQPAAH